MKLLKKSYWMFAVLMLACNDEAKYSSVSEHPQTKTDSLQPKNDVTQEIPKSAFEKEALTLPSGLEPEDQIQFYREHEQYQKAILLTDSFIRLDASNYRWWSIKAILHFENDDTTSAIAAYEKALSIFPTAEDQLNLSMLYAGKGDKKCITITDEISRGGKGTMFPKIQFVIGTYYRQIGKKELALEAYDKCLHENYTFMDAYREKAILLGSMKKYPEAINTLIRAVTIQNAYEEGYYYLGQFYEKIGDSEKAIESYQTALMYDPNDLDAKDCLTRLMNH